MSSKTISGLFTIMLIIGLYLFLRFVFGIFTPFNFWTARQDITSGKIQIATIGEQPLNFRQKQILANHYGLNLYNIGCNISTDIINGTKYYNKKMVEHLESKFKPGWWTKFQTQLDSIDNSFSKKLNDKIKFHHLKKLIVVGDFDGDGTKDTVIQHNYSKLTRTEIKSSPDPLQNEWEKVVKWFYNQKADLYLTINNQKQDTLHLGTAQGLYCLINIGDNNADGKDEIAFVIELLDFSNVNTCKIYSLCKNKWTQLKLFGVHEGAFDYASPQAPTFVNIKDFLEKQNGKWLYTDYLNQGAEKQKEPGKRLRLKPDKCN